MAQFGKFTSGSRISASRSELLKVPIVYLPAADFAQNLRETQAKMGDLKPFAQRYF